MSTRRVDVRDRAAARLAELRFRSTPRHERQEKGQILVLFAMAIIVIMLFASIVIDLGLLRNNRQILVNAIDGGALAGGTLMPLDGCNNPQSATAACASFGSGAALTRFNQVHDLIRDTIQQTYPGITEGASGWQMSYRCLIGVDASTPPQPYISRDIPVVCNPRHAGLNAGVAASDHNVTTADFQDASGNPRGAGATRWSYCYPNLGDRCNVVYITGIRTTNYSFGRVVGVNQGSTGAVASAACNGPCGQPPAAPVDLVVLLDRTGSMSDAQIASARDAARAVLGVYDPALQRVAIGFIGPSKVNTSCSGGGGGPAVNVMALTDPTPNPPTYSSSTTASTPAAGTGASTLTINRPGAANATTTVLVAAITVNNSIRVSPSVTGNVLVQAPGGWTHIRTTNNANTIGVATFYKVGTSTEPASYQWTFRDANIVGNPLMNVRASGGVLRFTDALTSDPIDVDGGNTGSDTTGTITASASAVTTTVANTGLITVFGMANSAGGFGGYYTNWTNSTTNPTEQVDLRNLNTAGPSLGVATKGDATAGGSNATTADLDGGGSYAAQHVALNPDPSNNYGTSYPADLAKWIPIGFTGTDSDSPSQAWNEAYVDTNGVLQDTTHIVSAINCFDHPGGVGTNLTNSTRMAADYLENFGRPNVKWGIILDTDGQPEYGGTGDPGNYTCQSTIDAANYAKGKQNANGQNIELFTVGFLDPGTDPNCPDTSGTYLNQNLTYMLSRAATGPELAPIPNGTANGCVAAENTDQDHFFCDADAGQLETIFSVIATTFAGIRTHLVQLDPLPAVYDLSVHTGPSAGGTFVQVTGKYFTGATSVRFGGANVVCPSVACTVNNDGLITVTSPAGTLGSTVEVIVTTPAGSSPLNPGNPGDSFTYT